uniref:Uncharacterized protein n=1 Tax=Arundo donax TaxID=35708 RepID=A0A0A9DHC4_ARUDO
MMYDLKAYTMPHWLHRLDWYRLNMSELLMICHFKR